MNIKEKNDNIYESLISYCENNFGEEGHKHATELTKLVLIGQLPPELKRYYNLVTNEPKKSVEIAFEADKELQCASSCLHTLELLGLIFNVSENKKNKVWVLM